MMQLGTTREERTQHYTHAVDSLSAIANASFFEGRFSEAQHVLRSTLGTLETRETPPELRLKLLLLYGRVLCVEHLIVRQDAAGLLTIVEQVQQLAATTSSQRARADALSLLGHTNYVTTVVARLKAGLSPNSAQEHGHYQRALDDQQQAFHLRKAVNDTRGMSESSFHIGTVYERWGQDDQAQAYYTTAYQLAEQHHHRFEQTEPMRHFALYALKQGDLDRALTRALEALKLREATGFKPYQPFDHLLISNIYAAKHDSFNAQIHMQHAATIAEDMGFTTLVATTPNMQTVQAAWTTQA